ncbi:MAG: BspA family leucine-rich repeat surface protein [Candidatus Nanopelagicaceae bacterium]
MTEITRRLRVSEADPYAGQSFGNDFVVVFNTYLSTGTTVSVPLQSTVNCTVNWGDGFSDSYTTTGEKSHTYAADGEYVVRISGTLGCFGTQFGFSSATARPYLTRCIQFGSVGMTRLTNAFKNCVNFSKCPATLPSTITSLEGTFSGCSIFNDSNVTGWNTSSVTTLNSTFSGCKTFNQNLNSWNTANVTNMSSTFSGADVFNQPLANWNTAAVTTMYGMFLGADLFNQPLNTWNVANVTTFELMFQVTKFNQPLDTWNVNKAISFYGMFAVCPFNQDIDGWQINTSTLVDVNMGDMFRDNYAFNFSLNSWNTSRVNNMAFMFSASVSNNGVFNGNIADWDTSRVTSMLYMFSYQPFFNQNLSGWCVSLISSKPSGFDTGATAWQTAFKPVWGTCPP